MIQMTALLLLGGVLDRFRRLRLAFLEAGVGWVPYMMDRLDRGQEVWRRSQRVEYAANLAGKPSEHIRSGRCFFAVEGEETTLPYVAERVGEDVLLFASDFPHEVSPVEIKREIGEFIEREDISERLKRKILSENAKRFYKLS
jgi:predicted TIM-barrel fold metal-dependent hydrolase